MAEAATRRRYCANHLEQNLTMPSFHVTVSDSVFPNLDPARRVLSSIGAELCMADSPTPEGIVAAAASSDALLVTYAKITADMIQAMPKCRVISRFGIGVDNVDIPAATIAGIIVTKVPDYCIDEVSDHAMALLLAIVRKIPSSSARTHGGRWEMKAVVPIHRLRDSVLGLAGFGRIPQLVVPKAKAFGMKVLAYDPFVPEDVFRRAGVERVELAQLLATSDYVSVHTPLTPETKHLFNRDTFARMKRGAYIVNTARGPIIDEAALAEALDSGQIAGAALDVMTQEPPPASPLFGRDNVIITPHTSFYSEESLVELQVKAAQEVVAVLSGKSPRNPVNPEALT
jgi:D-3-phosphoglycerate dehydrogenase